jgi:hypothetical protein
METSVSVPSLDYRLELRGLPFQPSLSMTLPIGLAMDNDRVVVYYGASPFQGCLADAEAVREATSLPGDGPPLRDDALERARSSRELGVALREARRGEAERAPRGAARGASGSDSHAGGGSLLDLATGLLHSSRSALGASAQRLLAGGTGGNDRRPLRDGSQVLPDQPALLLLHPPASAGEEAVRRSQPPLQGGGHVAIRVTGQHQRGGHTRAAAAAASGGAQTPIRTADAPTPLGTSTPGGAPPRPRGANLTAVSPSGKRFVSAHVAALSRVVVRVRMMNRVKGLLVVRGKGQRMDRGARPPLAPPPLAPAPRSAPTARPAGLLRWAPGAALTAATRAGRR